MPQSELYKLGKKMMRANPCFVPIPASTETKRPIGNWKGDAYVFERDFEKREKWGGGNTNLGLLVTDNYIVIDVDAKPPAHIGNTKVYSEKKGTEDFETLCKQNEEIPPTLTAITPSGGKHYYFTLCNREEETSLKNWQSCMTLEGKLIAIDIRKKGGYVMAPPSSRNGLQYRWTTEIGFKAPMAPLPRWILQNICNTMKKHPKHFERQVYTCDPSANGDISNGDIELFKSSEYWQDCFSVTPSPNMSNVIRITARAPYHCDVCEREHVSNTNHPFLVRNHGKLRFVCRPGKGFNKIIEADFARLLADFDRATRRLIETGDISDRAISELFNETLNGTVLSTAKENVWLMFDQDTGIWREEHRNVIMRPIFDLYVGLFQQLAQIYKKLSKDKDDIWAQRTLTSWKAAYNLSTTFKKNGHLAALFELVRDSRKDDLFNSKDLLLHCRNGVFDLETGTFRPSRPDDYSTLSTKLEYLPYEEHPSEKRSTVENFLLDIMLGNHELIHYLLKALSSALDGRVVDQLFYIFLASGSNGKSLLIKLMKRALGDYYATLPSAQVSKPNVNAQSATPSLIKLVNKRAALLTELEDKVLYTEFVKMVAGGDETSGRGLFNGQRNIKLQAKVFIAVNDLPTIEDKTYGFWRKLVIIPFKATFVTNPRLKHEKAIIDGFEETLLNCADTFLALLIKTYTTSYKTEGVRVPVQPAEVRQLVQQYEQDQNIPLQFWTVSCKETCDLDDHVETKNLDEAFANFCKSKAIIKTSQLVRHLYEFLDKKHPPKNARRQVFRKGKNLRAWVGLKLENDWSLGDGEEEEEET